MKQRICVVVIALLATLVMQAQHNTSDINRIKRNKSYLYGEATLDKKEAALKLAYELLETEIKTWAQQKNSDISMVVARNIIDFADTIILPRGNMVRAFAYVKISDLKSTKGREMEVKVKEPLEAEPVKAEKPVKAEEPVTAEEPVKAEEPLKAEAPEVEKEKTAEETVLEQLLSLTSFYDLEKPMKQLKEAGLIEDYGKYTTMTDPASCFLIVYDQQAVVKAILGKGSASRQNLKTGQADSEKNYHGCGALWFKVKKQE